MTDWGIPDGRDVNAYGDWERWSDDRWRWEFTRRRADCREDFEAHKGETVAWHERIVARLFERFEHSPDAIQRVRLRRADEPGFTAQVPCCYEKYGLDSLPSPAIGDQPSEVILFRKRGPWMMVPDDGRINRLFQQTDAVINFDLTAPVEAQLKVAKQLLEDAQKHEIGQLVLPGRLCRDKWLRHLRVLDAKESNASNMQIAKDVLGWTKDSARSDPKDLARDAVWRAETLRDNWPV
jgi:hypothetical protein